MEATDCEALKEPICECEKFSVLADPILLCENDIGRPGPGRAMGLLFEAIAPVQVSSPHSPLAMHLSVQVYEGMRGYVCYPA